MADGPSEQRPKQPPQLTRLQAASLRLKQQIASTTSRSSRRVALAQGPLSAPEVLSMLLANQVCTMMALADFLDSLEGDPIRDG